MFSEKHPLDVCRDNLSMIVAPKSVELSFTVFMIDCYKLDISFHYKLDCSFAEYKSIDWFLYDGNIGR